jgi:hypothetical protein
MQMSPTSLSVDVDGSGRTGFPVQQTFSTPPEKPPANTTKIGPVGFRRIKRWKSGDCLSVGFWST